MGEYLFRGKRLDNGEWVQGALVYDGRDKLYRIITEINYSTGTCLTTNKAPRVDASTICQCTGLKDKNGTKIFEGDIIDFSHRSDSESYGVVKYDTYETEFAIVYDSIYEGLGRHYHSRDVEVIGNIYDNPEPMKGDGNNA